MLQNQFLPQCNQADMEAPTPVASPFAQEEVACKLVQNRLRFLLSQKFLQELTQSGLLTAEQCRAALRYLAEVYQLKNDIVGRVGYRFYS